MTEEQWSGCTNTDRAIAFLKGRATDRKMRLFACACCRRVRHLLGGACREAIEATEAFADAPACRQALARCEKLAYAESQEPRVGKVGPTRCASLAAWC